MHGNRRQFLAGFTLVELGIVIVVLGILAGVSVIGYGKWRESIAKKEVQSDLQIVTAAMENVRNFKGEYPNIPDGTVFDGNATTRSIFTQGGGVLVTYYRGDSKMYCIDARSVSQASVAMFLDSSGGNKEPGQGTCEAYYRIDPPSISAVATSNKTTKVDIVTPTAGAESYVIQRSLSSSFSSGVSERTRLPGVPLEDNGLTSGTLYYYRAKANTARGVSGWSSAISVRTTSNWESTIAESSSTGSCPEAECAYLELDWQYDYRDVYTDGSGTGVVFYGGRGCSALVVARCSSATVTVGASNGVLVSFTGSNYESTASATVSSMVAGSSGGASSLYVFIPSSVSASSAELNFSYLPSSSTTIMMNGTTSRIVLSK